MKTHYKINVAKKWGHGTMYRFFFRTDETITGESEAREVYGELKKAFPAPQYSVTLHHVKVTGEVIDAW